MTSFYPLPEWYPQQAAVLIWPHPYSDWADTLENIEHTYLLLAKAISNRQLLLIIHFDHQHKELIKEQCARSECDMKAISFLEIETNDTWIRDYGPVLLLGNKEYKYLDFEFNAWGEQYPHRLDYLFSEKLFTLLKPICSYQRLPLVLEGGNLDFNNNAALLTNHTCTMRNNVKTKLTLEDLTKFLKQQLSAKHVLGLQVPALEGDDTGGHIDTLARFVSDDTIVYASTSEPFDSNRECLNILYEQLRQFRTPQGKPLKLIPIPMPKYDLHDNGGNKLPASYINFVYINNAMIIPTYNDEHDTIALKRFKDIHPDRDVIGVDATNLIQQFGSLHCATLNIPESFFDENRINSTQQ